MGPPPARVSIRSAIASIATAAVGGSATSPQRDEHESGNPAWAAMR